MYHNDGNCQKYLSREEVPEYLTRKYGAVASVTVSTLAKLAVTGGGPEFTKFGRRVAYSPEKLDQWVCSRGKSFNSTSGVSHVS